MLRGLRKYRRGVSPVIAVLLMVAIAVAASILVYVWSMGLIGTLTTGGGQQLKEQVILEAYKWNGTTGPLDLYLRNVGNSEVVVDAVYVSGINQTITPETLKVQGPTVKISIENLEGTYTSGVAYTVKVVTKTGGVFTYSVICGSSG
ncbi:MAG: archaellin/type IV pilin N-terminal domain-containing protein [Candidatus Bathyarchaeia archaeon]